MIAVASDRHAIGFEGDRLVARRTVEGVAAEAVDPADAQLHHVAVRGRGETAEEGIGRRHDPRLDRGLVADEKLVLDDFHLCGLSAADPQVGQRQVLPIVGRAGDRRRADRRQGKSQKCFFIVKCLSLRRLGLLG